MSVADTWRTRLRADLTAAMKARDVDATAVLRGAIAAIDNAEAVDVALPDATASTTNGAIAGASAGVGSTEIARRELTNDEVEHLVAAYLVDTESAAEQARMHGYLDRAECLRRQGAVLRAFMQSSPVTDPGSAS